MPFDYTLISEKPFEEVVDAVKKTLQELGFGTLWELDVPSKLKEKGVDFQGKARILEVCNPKRAKEALEHNMNVVYFLPCKVVVFEDQGQIKLGMVKPTAFMEMLQDEGLRNFALEVENTLKQAMDRAI